MPLQTHERQRACRIWRPSAFRPTCWISAPILLIGMCLISSCANQPTATLFSSETPTTRPPIATASAWVALLNATPLAHTAPLPDSVETLLDRTYAKLDASLPQWWLCRRCADYRPAGGIWKLQLDRGVMRILYDVTGWRSVASYTIVEERLYLFNDPFCPQNVGEYAWILEDNSLTLEVINDSCSFGLREENLSTQPWAACSPPGDAPEGADWESPVGCAAGKPPGTDPSGLQLDVAVHPGNSRSYPTPPDVIVEANLPQQALAEGILLSYDSNSISYGMNRVLWWEGDWIEVSSEQPFAAMGVQFMGDPPIGWARVLFDGVEVWRGNTSEIWSEHGRHGGYVEVSGFQSGMHSMRVESMGFDYHPVTVAWFGFSYEVSVQPK